MMTKKVIALILGLGLYACGTKDEPISNTTKKETQTNPTTQDNSASASHTTPQLGNPIPSPEPNPQVERPDNYNMAKRCQIEWVATEDKRYTDFDLEGLMLDKQFEKYTLSYLRPFIKLYSSAPGGNIYTFVDEDYQNTTIKSIQYNRTSEQLELTISYKGISSNVLILSFKLREYFDRKVKLKTNFASSRYAEGFCKHPDLYVGDVLEYDKERYVATILKESGIHAEGEGQAVSFSVRVGLRDSEEFIVLLNKTLRGFRSLDNLKKDMFIASSAGLVDYFRPKLKAQSSPADLTARFKGSTTNWMRLAQLGIRESVLRNTGTYTWEPEEINYRLADLYFTNMNFELKSARLEGKDLKLRVALVYVNDVSLSGVEYDLSVVSVID